MKVILIGEVQFSAAMLDVILAANVQLVGVVTRRRGDADSDRLNLLPYARAHGVPCLEVDSVNEASTRDWIAARDPDLVLCLGWSELLDSAILSLAPGRMIGYHPAKLPRNRGRHPIIWALALGLTETASTFFLLDERADAGPIVDQADVPIFYEDYASELYSRLISTAGQQLGSILSSAASGALASWPQEESQSTSWRRRHRADGIIDWRMSSESIRNLIRALAPPYPGASFRYREDYVVALRSHVVDWASNEVEPGRVLARDIDSVLVKTGDGAIAVSIPSDSASIRAGDCL